MAPYLLCQPVDNDGKECVGGVELEEVHGVVEGVGRPVGVNGEEELGCNSIYHLEFYVQILDTFLAISALG